MTSAIDGRMRLDLGQELRRARDERGESLRVVASEVGVSASMLSQVETGKAQPSVSTLCALVSHYGLSLDALLGASAPLADDARGHRRGEPFTRAVQRAGDNPTIEMENGVVWERLAVGNSLVADAFVVTYAPAGGSSPDGSMTRHRGVEYGYLLTGRLTLLLDSRAFVLEQGDSFSFESERPHRFHNDGDIPAKGVWLGVDLAGVSGPHCDGAAGQSCSGMTAAAGRTPCPTTARRPW